MSRYSVACVNFAINGSFPDVDWPTQKEASRKKQMQSSKEHQELHQKDGTKAKLIISILINDRGGVAYKNR